MKILVADPISQLGIDRLKQDFPTDVRLKMPKEELLECIGEYDALVVRSETQVTAEVIEHATQLKVIGRAGVGIDNIDVEAATQAGIIVLNTPDGNTFAAAEHTIALLMAMVRNVPAAHASTKAGKWERSKFMGVEVRQKTLGLVGLGRIGGEVAKRAQGLEMKVIVFDPFVSQDRAEQLGVEIGTLEEVIARADFISVHAPLNAATRNLIDSDQFALMKDGVRIINCARGGIINEAALAEAVRSGKVAQAAIDVFSKEPAPPDNPLLGVDRIILTPHLGASTVEAQVNVAVDVAEGVIAGLKGEPVVNAVNLAAVSSDTLTAVRPYLTLAERLGSLYSQLAEKRVEKVELTFRGEIANTNTAPLTTAVLVGLLSPALDAPVNQVNAPLLAKARGIKVQETRNPDSADYSSVIELRVRTTKGVRLVAGTVFGKNEPRLVAVDEYNFNGPAQGRMLFCPHTDKPGVVGKVGTLLGQHGVNISGMQVSPKTSGGLSLMVLSIDADVPEDLLPKIRAMEEIEDVRWVKLND